MSKILYIFPHPDDESFGPAAAIHSQIKRGNQVSLLTLTKGGATKQRHKLGLSVKEMGEVRHREMLDVKKKLKLNNMEVMDFPDSGLKEMDVRILEQAVKDHIEKLKPHIVVTYPVHGISGFHDHLVTHAVVKRVYLEIRDAGTGLPKRLAFWTMPDSDEPTSKPGKLPRLKLTEEDLIDCIFPLNEDDIEAMRESLKCYASYQEVIKKIAPVEQIGDKAHFEIFGESFEPVLDDLTKEM